MLLLGVDSKIILGSDLPPNPPEDETKVSEDEGNFYTNICYFGQDMPPKRKAKKDENSAPEKKEKPDVEYNYWLMKSEPETRLQNGVDMKFGIEDLKLEPEQTACWDGVRNYQARNFMRQMRVGQLAFFYHSNCKEPGIAGIVKIVKEAYPDHTQFDKKDVHYDPKSKESDPRWSMVDVHYQRMTKRYIPLAELKQIHLHHKQNGGPLANVALFTRARLSVQPLTEEEWNYIITLEEKEAD